MGFLVVAEHPSKNITARRKASPLGCGTSQNSSEPRWTWLQNTQKEKCLKEDQHESVPVLSEEGGLEGGGIF